MKLFVQAVQAVTVELLGVLLVVWMLFGFAAWGLHRAAGEEMTWSHQFASAVESWQERAAELLPTQLENPESEPQRTEYVARRLDYYGHILGAVSQNLWRETWQVEL